MSKDIKFKKISKEVNRDYISKIGSIVDKVRNVSFEVFFNDIKIYELENTIIAIMSMRDGTGNMSALIISNRDKENKDIIKSINLKDKFVISGSVSVDIDSTYQMLNELTNNKVKKELLKDKVLLVNGISKMKHKENNVSEKVELFGVSINKLYDYDLDKAYDLIKANTDYLNDISKGEVKNINFSYYKDIIIALKSGIVLVNGKKEFENIEMLHMLNSVNILAISRDKIIYDTLGFDNLTRYINNNNYRYKKVIAYELGIVALTYENEIKATTPLNQVPIDYKKFYEVEDIGYIEENDDIVSIKDGKVYSLFDNYDYSNEIPEVMIGGKLKDRITIIK